MRYFPLEGLMVEYRELARDPEYRVGSDGSAWSKKSGEWVRLRASPDPDGYPVIAIGEKHYTVHSLILEAFVGPRPEGRKGLHRNDVKADNRLENLYWGTNRQNAQDAVRNGKVKLQPDAEKAREAVRLKGEGLTHLEIGERLGVSGVAVHKILCGKLWAEATGISPRKKGHFEGPELAARLVAFHSWGWPPEALAAFFDVKPARLRRFLSGRAYGRATGLGKQPTRNESIRSKVPEILQLCNEEGWPTKKVAALLGVSLRKVQYVVKEHAA